MGKLCVSIKFIVEYCQRFSHIILMASSLFKAKIVNKRRKKFKRFQSDRKAGSIKPNWRRPRGIDSAVRRKFKGRTVMPNIGYGTNKKFRHILPNGFLKFVVNNINELEMLFMQNRVFAAEISRHISSNKRKDIVNRAYQLNINVLNLFFPAKSRVLNN